MDDKNDILEIRFLKGIGEKKARLFEKLGVFDVRSLISLFPRAYDDRTVFKTVEEAQVGETVCVRATPDRDMSLRMVRRGLDILKCSVFDGTGSLSLVFFNQSWIKDALSPGADFVFYGKIGGTLFKKEMQNPVFEPVSGSFRNVGRIVPVYPLTSGLTQTAVAQAVRQGLLLCGDAFPEALPREIRERHRLCCPRFAYENIHFPESGEALAVAKRMLVFEELFILSLGLRLLKSRRERGGAPSMPDSDLSAFIAALPFKPTGAQSRAVDDILSDLRGTRPASRLIQGDVGSGKTFCAAAGAYIAAKNGFQAALMAPTEILAEQHARELVPLFAGLGILCRLLTGSTPAAEKKKIRRELSSGECGVVIGTHALISESVEFAALGLVITDEQHRFGVEQRARLLSKGQNPHLIVMSATPIPRTLSLILYGDLDVSVIDELPPGRQKIDTFAFGGDMRPRVYEFVRKLAEQGRQAYIVCPLVEDSDSGAKAAVSYAESLGRDVFPDLRVGFVHGKMKGREKDAVMRAFLAHELDVLVATTVIEVGVSVSNAAIIIIENAESFGLSQLHQLRGRVGRGEHKSYCILFSDNPAESVRTRLETMKRTSDGFEISEADLRQRGPGDFFGSRQHGMPELKIADLNEDMELVREASRAADALVKDDPDLALPGNIALRGAVFSLFKDENIFN